MIGWENNQGAYFIQKLQEDISNVDDKIGTLSTLTTEQKDDLVKAVNEVNSDISSLSTSLSALANSVAYESLSGTDAFTVESGTLDTFFHIRQGNMCFINFTIGGFSTGTDVETVLGAIKKYKPDYEVWAEGFIGSGNAKGDPVRLVLRTNGNISMFNGGKSGTARCSIAYALKE